MTHRGHHAWLPITPTEFVTVVYSLSTRCYIMRSKCSCANNNKKHERKICGDYSLPCVALLYSFTNRKGNIKTLNQDPRRARAPYYNQYTVLFTCIGNHQFRCCAICYPCFCHRCLMWREFSWYQSRAEAQFSVTIIFACLRISTAQLLCVCMQCLF
jgi:hypothetical protein